MQAHQWEMWTSQCSLLVDTEDEADLATALKCVEGTCQEVERAINRFDPSSEISTILASVELEFEVSDTLAQIIALSLKAYELTGGAFDPRVGQWLENAGYGIATFHFGVKEGELVPTALDNQKLTDIVTMEGNLLRFSEPVFLDLTSLGKSFAADRSAHLAAQEIGAPVLVNLGGDIATAGSRGAWAIEVRDLDSDPASKIALINNSAIATSSTQKRRWKNAGGMWHHIIDPRTGLSAHPEIKTASVIADTPVVANTLSTSAIVWAKDAPAHLSQFPYPFRLVMADNRVIEHNWPAQN